MVMHTMARLLTATFMVMVKIMRMHMEMETMHMHSTVVKHMKHMPMLMARQHMLMHMEMVKNMLMHMVMMRTMPMPVGMPKHMGTPMEKVSLNSFELFPSWSELSLIPLSIDLSIFLSIYLMDKSSIHEIHAYIYKKREKDTTEKLPLGHRLAD